MFSICMNGWFNLLMFLMVLGFNLFIKLRKIRNLRAVCHAQSSRTAYLHKTTPDFRAAAKLVQSVPVTALSQSLASFIFSTLATTSNVNKEAFFRICFDALCIYFPV
jgi:hypothetical protein